MQRVNLEVSVGVFVILGMLALGYLSIRLGEIPINVGNTYTVTAVFPTVAGLKLAAAVEIAGVPIGQVDNIRLEEYEAVVILRLEKGIRLQEDAIVSIRIRGLIGEKFIRITPGGSERLIPAGGRLREVETPLDFEDLIGRFIQGKI